MRLHVLERTFREGLNRLEQVLEYSRLDPQGRVVQRSPERLTYYMRDPTPFAVAAGFVADRPATPLGGDGDIWVFRKR